MEKIRQQRRQDGFAQHQRRADFQTALRLDAALSKTLLGFVQFFQHDGAAFVKQPPFIGERKVARIALQQTHVQPRFQAGNSFADGGAGQPELFGGGGKRAAFDAGNKGRYIVEIVEFHKFFLRRSGIDARQIQVNLKTSGINARPTFGVFLPEIGEAHSRIKQIYFISFKNSSQGAKK